MEQQKTILIPLGKGWLSGHSLCCYYPSTTCTVGTNWTGEELGYMRGDDKRPQFTLMEVLNLITKIFSPLIFHFKSKAKPVYPARCSWYGEL